MSQADKEQKLRRDIESYAQIAKHRALFALEARRLAELTKDLAKIDARRASKAAP